MAEGGDNEAAAVLAEGGTVNQTIEGGTINVVAGDQIHGSQENIHNRHGIDIGRQGNATAMLAEGEHVDQRFTKCDVNVVAGDQIHGNVTYHIHRDANYADEGRRVVNAGVEPDCSSGRPTHYTYQNDGITQTQKRRKIIGDPKYNSWFIKLKEKMTGGNYKKFAMKINKFSLDNVQGMVTQNYEDLSEPDKEYYPQMKTGFKLFRGDYVPQDGFSAHCKPKSGNYIDFETCAKIVAETRNQPCFIIGQPGSGKTITMKRLARTFLTPKCIGACGTSREGVVYDVILHMNIRDIPNTSSGTLAEVIFSPSVTGLTTLEAQYGLESILENKNKIIMFFDGLDQATWEPSCDRKIGPWETASTATIFGNILAGQLLSEVPIAVSSREHSIARLEQNMRPKFIAALVGFSDNDAKALYCEIMGQEAEDVWNSMRISNPAMHYMCRTPVFLIFYMISRKANPEDPPDCATEVMVCIIQIFLECENARKIDHNTKITELLNNLKKMAFHGTKNQRVVFDDEDLKRFNLAYDVISDIMIKVPGFSILGQKILEGMFRFFFSHQTLQEILSALRVVELDYSDFTQIVDEEFPKPYWSVVRSFTCGILKNEGIGNRITTTILKSISDLKKKCEYLMTHLQQQLLCDGSPANKLETFVALREANALDVLRGFAEDLDFSNIPLTPAMINTLCSVMKYIGEVRLLSLANSGMDEELLRVFEKGTRGLGIKVAILDIRGNGAWKEWTTIFENMTISECFMDVSGNDETETDGNVLLNIVNAASANNIGQLHLGEVKKIRLNIEQLSKLTESKVQIQLMIKELHISPTTVELGVWKQAFQQMTFAVQHCLVENPLPNPEGEVDVDLWIAVLEAALCARYDKKVSLTSEKISMTIGQVESINQSKIGGEIDELYIRAEGKSLQADVWRQIFQELTFTVQHCSVESPLPNEKGKVDISAWIDVLEAVRVVNVKKVSLTSKKISMGMSDITAINHLGFCGEIHILYLLERNLSGEDWRQLGEVTCKFNVTKLYASSYDIPDVRSFVNGHGNAKVKKILILPLHYLCLSRVNAESYTDPGQVKSFAIKLPSILMKRNVKDVGRLISESDPDDNEVVMYSGPYGKHSWTYHFNVDELASGLNGFKIKELVIEDVAAYKLVHLVRKCNVENLFLREDCDVDLDEIRGLTSVTVLSYEEIDERLENARR